ncbi:MAG TPA: hypothetical protein VEZ46_18035, partial [Mycobacteriales bacterium]|nr:hypothetical protein [Mycobacteriales bacterium]
PDDAEGLLCGPGQVVRRPDAARVSVVVADRWRVAPLVEALRAAGLAAEAAPAHEAEMTVRTAFEPGLLAVADAWQRAGAKRAPADLSLDGPRLRFWALAAGRRDSVGYLLGLAPTDEAVWSGVGGALSTAGLAAVFVGPRADGPAYRITGARRLDRFRELIGDRPEGVPPEGWLGDE